MSAQEVLTQEEVETLNRVVDYIKAKKWGLKRYPTRFLALMITLRESYRKEAESEEDIPKMPQLARETMDLMPVVYDKKIMKVSWKKSLNDLSEALNASRIPEEYLSGQSVSHTVKKLSKEIQEV